MIIKKTKTKYIQKDDILNNAYINTTKKLVKLILNSITTWAQESLQKSMMDIFLPVQFFSIALLSKRAKAGRYFFSIDW